MSAKAAKPPRPTELDRYKAALAIARDTLSTIYGLRYVADAIDKIDRLVTPRAKRGRAGR